MEMTKMAGSLHKWHQSKFGFLVFGLAELAIAYGWAGLAIDRGGPWWYLLTLIFLFGALRNFFKLIGKLIHVGRKAN